MSSKKDWTELCIRSLARKAIEQNAILEYILYWMEQPKPWENLAKRILIQEIRKKYKDQESNDGN